MAKGKCDGCGGSSYANIPISGCCVGGMLPKCWCGIGSGQCAGGELTIGKNCYSRTADRIISSPSRILATSLLANLKVKNHQT
jgi:hypothetical protein